jgi:hypothetical protein
VKVPAPPVGWFIADAYVSPPSGSTHGPAGLTRACKFFTNTLAAGAAIFQSRELSCRRGLIR